MFKTALFIIGKTWRPPKCPSTDEWIKKMWCINTMEYYSSIEKKEILPFVTIRMDLENIILSDTEQRQISYDITNMWNLKSNINQSSYKTKIESQT